LDIDIKGISFPMGMDIMKNKSNKVLIASAVAIMLAPAALGALPQQIVHADAVGTVSTQTPVYDANGKDSGITLPSGSQWKLGQQITLNGVAHYQVGTNEYIPASVVTNVTGSSNPSDNSVTNTNYVEANPDAGKTGTATTALDVVDRYGNSIGTTLPSGSQWLLGEILHANKQTYVQIATNEYVSTLSISTANSTTNTTTNNNTNTNSYTLTDDNAGKTASTTDNVQVVDDNGNNTGITLPKGSQWVLGKYMSRDKVAYYQVATNEWVPAYQLSIAKGSTNGSYITDDYTQAGKTGTATANLTVYNGAGQQTGKTLPNGSQWKLGSSVLHYDKQLFLQVSGNEYVPAIYLTVGDIQGVRNQLDGLVGTTNVVQKTYDTATNTYGQTLQAGTSWKINRLVVNKYGSYWGQISTNDWVWISDVTLNSGLNLKDNSYYEPEFAVNLPKQ